MKETKFILCVFINTRIFFYLFTLKTNKRPSGLNGHLSFNCNAMKMKQNHITIHNKVSYSRCCFCRQLKLSVHVNCNQCHFINYVEIIEFLYCTLSFLVTKSFFWYQNICPCDLGHQWNWQLSGAFFYFT